jgi:hypothetical protein
MKAPAPQRSLPIGVPELEVALSKARAARILLEAGEPGGDYLQIPVPLKPGETAEELRGWIRGFAFDALDAALEEAEAVRQKVQGPPMWGPTRKAVA